MLTFDTFFFARENVVCPKNPFGQLIVHFWTVNHPLFPLPPHFHRSSFPVESVNLARCILSSLAFFPSTFTILFLTLCYLYLYSEEQGIFVNFHPHLSIYIPIYFYISLYVHNYLYLPPPTHICLYLSIPIYPTIST